jgi:hypothetical protein
MVEIQSIKQLLSVSFGDKVETRESPMNPVIIIPCFNRLSSLEQLIHSVQRGLASSGKQEKTDIIFSVDKGAGDEVLNYLRDLLWDMGEKNIIQHQDKLFSGGNNFFCLGLAARYDNIIILEEDCFVAEGFFPFAHRALLKYREEPKVAGISLYDYGFNEEAHQPFLKMHNGDDIFFCQKASTRGLAMNRRMVVEFRDWIKSRMDKGLSGIDLPGYIRLWNDELFGKWFNAYLSDTGKFFVHPYHSFSTNFGVKGSNVKKEIYENAFQVPLQSGFKRSFILPEYTAAVRYDMYCELIHEEYEFDLYGVKQSWTTDKPHVITSRKVSKFVRSYGRNLKPHELNVIYAIGGRDLYLAKKEDVNLNESKSSAAKLRAYYYYYPDFSIAWLIRMKLREITKRFFN